MKFRPSQRTTVVVLLAVLVVGATSLPAASVSQTDAPNRSAQGEETNRSEEIRVAHMSPGAPPVDVFVDDRLIAENVSFTEVSEYRAIAPGERRLVVRDADEGDEVYNASGPVPERDTLTFLLTGTFTSGETFDLDPRLLVDNFSAPSEGNASVRLVHASPDAESVDVTLDDGRTVLFDNVSFRQDSGYVTGRAGNYTLEIREEDEDNDDDIIETFNVSLESETVTTVFASGFEDPDDAPINVSFGKVTISDTDDERNETAQMREMPP